MAYYASERKGRVVLMTASELLHGVTDQESFDSQYESYANDLTQQHKEESTKVAYETKDNTIKLWKRKKTERDSAEKKYPNYTGNGMVHGQECKASLWHNTTKSGNPQLNITLKFNDGTTTSYPKEGPKADLDDDIPF